MKKTISTFAAFALAVTAMAQTPKPGAAPAAQKPAATAAATPADADPVIMSAGDTKVRKSEFEAALRSLPQEYQQMVGTPDGRKQFADEFLRMKQLASAGFKAGLDKDPQVVSSLNLMRENLVANAEVSALDKSIVITDADLHQFYDSHKNEYEQVKARHILIAPKGSRAAQPGKKELTDEEAKAKAEDLRKKIVAGADFAALAKTESDDTGSGAQGGDLGAFNRGQMVPEFEKAAFEGKPGEVTPVVKTEFGYHLIQVQEHSVTPFEQVKPTIERGLRQQRLAAKIDELKGKATYDDAYFAGTKVKMPVNPNPGAMAPEPGSKQ